MERQYPIIEIQEGVKYSGADVVDRLNLLLDAVAHHRADDPLRYSASDTYWIIRDLFRYVNTQLDRGEFRMVRLKKGAWRLQYDRKTAAERKADSAADAEVSRTRDYINRLKQ